jgi:OmpA-OmpF porin, OOP family
MSCKHALAIICFAGGAALPLSALSQAYAGASIGTSDYKNFCRDLGEGCDKSGTAWRLFAGYFFTPNLGAEVGYVEFGKALASDAGSNVRLQSRGGEALAVLAFPANQFSIFGKVGAYYAGSRLTIETPGAATQRPGETNTGLTYGVGAQWDFTRNLGVRGDYQRYAKVGGSDTGGTTDIDVFTIGLAWKFR